MRDWQLIERQARGAAAAEALPPKDPGRRRSDRLLLGQTRILESVALGRPLEEILAGICLLIEEHTPRVLCSILLLDDDGRRLHHGAGPSLPPAYCQAIDGIEIGPTVGSCGTAAFRRTQVIVSDVATDPLWKDYRDLALAHRLRACWSTPIIARSSQVLGTFAVYYREPRSPQPEDLQLVADATHLVGVAVERELMDQALRRSEQRYRTVVETAGNAIVCLDSEGRIIEWNTAAERLFGYARTEVLGQDYAELCLLSGIRQTIVAELQAILAGGLPKVLEHPVRIRGGKIRTVSWNISGLHDAEGIPYGVVTIGQDMTDRQRAEEAQYRAQKLESLSILAGGAARDLEAAVASVIHNVRVIRRKLPSGSPERDLVDRIRSAAEQAADLADQMLAYAGRERGSLHAVFLNRLIEEAHVTLEEQVTPAAQLALRLPPEVSPIFGDPAQLKQVLANLVANASDALPASGGSVVVSAGQVEADSAYLLDTYPGGELPGGTYVFVRVADDGCGMGAEVQSKIFDPFFTTKPDRHGLGLAVALGIVRAHRGTIKVESAVNSGTTMTVLLPLPPHHN